MGTLQPGLSKDTVARIAHEVNREYCLSIGDDSQVPYDEAPDWQKQSARDGVAFVRDSPDAPASAVHDSWLRAKDADGWVYGEVKDAELKTHPCIVPYHELPEEQRFKDALFRAVVRGATVQD